MVNRDKPIEEKFRDDRKDYSLKELTDESAALDPFTQFQRWYEAARSTGMAEPNAMTLATASREGRPSARTVLLKGFNTNAFEFYTNYQSRKGSELQENPFAALLFYWPDLERQVRVEGQVEKMSPAESDAYFKIRPRGAQVGASASPQSSVMRDRQALEALYAAAEKELGEKSVPRPDYWGGYRLHADCIEFWQGRLNRMHDRIRYRKTQEGWVRERLAP